MMFSMVLFLTACGNSSKTEGSESQNKGSVVQQKESSSQGINETKRVASEGAQMQTSDPSKPTRVLEKGTRINMHFGNTLIPGILNDSTTAQAFIKMLPLTVHESRYSHDFCGSMDVHLPFDKKDERYGWLNGDIAIGTNVPWFTILFADEKISEQYGNLVNIGVIDCDLSAVSQLQGSYDVLIELAK